MKRKATLLSLIVAAAFLAASSSSVDAKVVRNQRATNHVELNKRSSNRLAGNELNANKRQFNKRQFNSVQTAAALTEYGSDRNLGEGAVITISTIELADGTRIQD